jgi:AraC-like DNA-binding protein
MPPVELGALVLPLPDLLGPPAADLLDRLHEAASWPQRFAVLDDVLLRCRHRLPAAAQAVDRAWGLLTARPVRVADVARQVGYTPRHLGELFTRELGLPPKTVARLARFDRARSLLQLPDAVRLADVAARCGYADQAHLTREWVRFAEVPPSRWLRSEDLLFVQDAEADPAARSSA